MHIFWRYLYRNGSICKVMTVARGVTIMLYFLFLPFLSIVSRMQTFDFLFIVQVLPFSFCYCIFYQVGLSFSSRKKSLSGGTITSISLLSSTRFCSPSSSTHSLSLSLFLSWFTPASLPFPLTIASIPILPQLLWLAFQSEDGQWRVEKNMSNRVSGASFLSDDEFVVIRLAGGNNSIDQTSNTIKGYVWTSKN